MMATCLQRKWQNKANDSSNVGPEISVVSYNILAECNFDDLTYPFCPPGHRGTNERHPKLMVEFEHHKDADILCLQEVETGYFHDLLKPSLSSLGFDGQFFSKVNEKDEGSAIFYKVSSMELISHQNFVFKDLLEQAARRDLDLTKQEAVIERCRHSSVAMVSTLRHKPSGREMSVMNVHLLWKTQDYLDVNTLQAAVSVRQLTKVAGKDRGMILCGDFNHAPHQPGYDVIANGKMCQKSVQDLQKYVFTEGCLIDVAPDWFQHSLEDLQSAYRDVLGSEPSFTVYTDPVGEAWLAANDSSKPSSKEFPTSSPCQIRDNNNTLSAGDTIRDTSEHKTLNNGQGPSPPSDQRTLDYIWFGSNHLICRRVLQVVETKAMEPFWACPNVEFPSDHMLIRADFVWKELR